MGDTLEIVERELKEMPMDDEYRSVLKAERAHGLEFSGDVIIVPSLEHSITGNAVWYGKDSDRGQESSLSLMKQAEMAEAHIVFKLVKVACYGQEGDRWADAVELVRSRPWAAKVVDNTRGAVSWLVFHWFCAYAAPCYALEAVLELHPKAIFAPDPSGRLPLHLALQAEAKVRAGEAAGIGGGVQSQPSLTLEALRMLIAAYPQACEATDSTGALPLHCAILSSSPLELVQEVISSYPEAVALTDGMGRNALHLALASAVSRDDETESTGAAAGVAPGRDRDRAPRVTLMGRSGNVDIDRARKTLPLKPLLEALLSAAPLAVEHVDGNDLSPLHAAVASGAGLDHSHEVIKMLLAACHEAAEWTDAQKRVPLHDAANMQLPGPTIQLLLEAHPRGIRQRDREEKLPLHLTAAGGGRTSMTTLRALLDADGGPVDIDMEAPWRRERQHYSASQAKEGLSESEDEEARQWVNKRTALSCDVHGRTPLHIAVMAAAPAPVLCALLDAGAGACLIADKDDRLPVHLAMLCPNVPVQTVHLLLRAGGAAAARHEDRDERLPLHIALLQAKPAEIVLDILRMFPDAAQHRDRERQLPLQLCDAQNYSTRVREEILRWNPDAASCPLERPHGRGSTEMLADGNLSFVADTLRISNEVF